MNFEVYFHEELVQFLDVKSQEDLFKEMFTSLYEGNYVKETYLNAIKDREVTYPTGLQTETLGVAIPHTDSIHVEREAIAVAILKNPVTFQHMGMTEVEVDVSLVFMLAIRKPENQLGVLQVITNLIQNKEILSILQNCNSEREVIEAIKEYSNEQLLSK
jgi:galactitol PTS system EIIA component